MKTKKLTNDLTLYSNKNFPKIYNKSGTKKYEVFLGIGGNMGDMFKRYDNLLKRFKYDTKISLLKTSPLLKNPPFGYLEQDFFLNGVIKIETNMPPCYLLKTMQKYEIKFQRVRSFKDAPRTLDIDILFIEKNGKKITINRKNLIVPHIGSSKRESVQIPYNEMEKKRQRERKKGM